MAACPVPPLTSRNVSKTWVQTAAALLLAAVCTACASGPGDLSDSAGSQGDSASGAASSGPASDVADHPGTGDPDEAGDPAAGTRAPTTLESSNLRPSGAGDTKQQPGTAAGSVVRVDPWRDGTEAAAHDAPEPAADSDSCRGSVTSPRADAFRCFHGSAIRDPCFVDPADATNYLCVPDEGTSWTRLRGLPASDPNPPGRVDRVFWATLTNGAECKAASGAGPTGLPGYQAWAGSCTGGPWTMQWLTWRVADDTPQGTEFPLLPGSGDASQWVAAVETTEGHVERVPVKVAYR